MIFPKPFAVDILDSGAMGRSLVQSADLTAMFAAMNSFTSGCQFADAGTNVSITATATDTPALKFFNSANSGVGGYLFTVESTIAGTTGTLPFVISAIEFDVNDDSSRDFCVNFGHGFTSVGTVAPGALWGASGIEFEQHFNPSSGVNQSETYFIHVSLAGQEYRGFSVTHQNHDRSDGTDTLLCGISADTIEFQNAVFTTRATWTDSGLQMASGQAFSLAGLIVSWNGTTGRMSTSALNNTFSGTLTTDDDQCLNVSPTINANSKTVYGTYSQPSFTSLTSGIFYSHRGFVTSNKAASTVGFTENNVGVSGAVTISEVFGHRTRLWATGGGTVTRGSGYLVATPFVSGATVTSWAGIRIEDHTGYLAFKGGTGKYEFGDNSANTFWGVFGTSGVNKQTVTGSRGGNAALASLITAMAAYGFVTDSSS